MRLNFSNLDTVTRRLNLSLIAATQNLPIYVIMGGMKARYTYRFYPTNEQRKSLAQLFGCVRVVWNDALALCRQSAKLPKNGDLQKLVITQAKTMPEREWLRIASCPE